MIRPGSTQVSTDGNVDEEYTTMEATSTLKEQATSVSALQGDAWAAWNASYYAEDREAYREVSLSLYRQDVHERIASLFARSDDQNTLLDAMLAASAKG